MSALKSISVLAVLCFVMPGCGIKFMKIAPMGAKITTPPEGKTVVNFHRPTSYGGGEPLYVFDRYKFIGNCIGSTSFQYVCDPGEHVFIGHGETRTVISAQLLADKVYDVVVDVGMGMWRASVKLYALRKNDERRHHWQDWEAGDERLLVLDELQPIANHEDRLQSENSEIMNDFLGGDKVERLQVLKEDDHR